MSRVQPKLKENGVSNIAILAICKAIKWKCVASLIMVTVFKDEDIVSTSVVVTEGLFYNPSRVTT